MFKKILVTFKNTLLLLVSNAFVGNAIAQDFPITIEHKFGTTVIKSEPKRVATLDFQGADDLLAIGVQPVAIRYWYGDHKNTYDYIKRSNRF